jgi:hypothetical protein
MVHCHPVRRRLVDPLLLDLDARAAHTLLVGEHFEQFARAATQVEDPGPLRHCVHDEQVVGAQARH